MTQALYAPWPDTARRTWGWGALGLMIAGYLASSVPVVVGTVIYTIVHTVSSGNTDPLAAQRALSENTLSVLHELVDQGNTVIVIEHNLGVTVRGCPCCAWVWPG